MSDLSLLWLLGNGTGGTEDQPNTAPLLLWLLAQTGTAARLEGSATVEATATGTLLPVTLLKGAATVEARTSGRMGILDGIVAPSCTRARTTAAATLTSLAHVTAPAATRARTVGAATVNSLVSVTPPATTRARTTGAVTVHSHYPVTSPTCSRSRTTSGATFHSFYRLAPGPGLRPRAHPTPVVRPQAPTAASRGLVAWLCRPWAMGAPVSMFEGWTDLSVSTVLSDVGAGTITLPSTWATPANLALLDEPVAVRVDLNGVPWCAFLVEDDKIDRVAVDGTVTLAGPGLGDLLSDGVVYPAGWPALTSTGARNITNVTAAGVFTTFAAEARSRGAASGLVTETFSAGADTSGVAWTDSQTLAVDVGTSMLELLRRCADVTSSDWHVDALGRLTWRRLFGQDRSATVRFVTDTVESLSTERTRAGLANALLMLTSDSTALERVDSSSVASWRRRERILQASEAKDNATRELVLESAQTEGRAPTRQISVRIAGDRTGERPVQDFDLGDLVGVELGDGTVETHRVLAVSARVGADGPTWEVTLENLLEDRLARIKRLLAAMSGVDVDAPGTTTPNPDVPDPIDVPAPSGVTVSTSALDQDSVASVSWAAVTSRGDGVAAYEAVVERIADGAQDSVRVEASPAMFRRLRPGGAHRARVRCVTRTGRVGEWSDWVAFTASTNAQPPSAPTGLTVVGTLRQLIATWAQNGEADVADGAGTYEVQAATDAAFTLNVQTFRTGALVASIPVPAPSSPTATPPTWWVRVRAVDASGNAGAWSASRTATVGRIGTGDYGPGTIVAGAGIIGTAAIDTAMIADAAIVRAKIATAAIDSARISDLTVTKLTGGTLGATVDIGAGYLRAVSGLRRIQLDSAGLRLYDGAGAEVVNLSTATGAATFKGSITSGSTITGAAINGGTITGSQGIYVPVDGPAAKFSVSKDGDVVCQNIRIVNNTGAPSTPGGDPHGPSTGRIDNATLNNVTIGGNSKGDFGGVYIGPWALGDMASVPQVRFRDGSSLSGRGGGIAVNAGGGAVAVLKMAGDKWGFYDISGVNTPKSFSCYELEITSGRLSASGQAIDFRANTIYNVNNLAVWGTIQGGQVVSAISPSGRPWGGENDQHAVWVAGALGIAGSSRKLKENIVDPDPAELGTLDRLRFRRFQWKERTGRPDRVRWGLIAEETHDVDPDLAGLNDDGEPASIAWDDVTALVGAAVQDLRRRVAALEEAR